MNMIIEIRIYKIIEIWFRLIWTRGLTENLKHQYNILNGKKSFALDGLQNYLVFATISKYLSCFSKTNKVYL